jgi:hypothetical protein
MTIPDLIETVLRRIWEEHYAHTGRHRDFFRDEQALTRSIARYGYECHNRGWEFEPEQIWAEIMRVLDTMRRADLEVRTWFPIYLEASIDRHLRLRADELSAEAKREDRSRMLHAGPRTAGAIADKVRAGLVVAEVREPTPVEQLAAV